MSFKRKIPFKSATIILTVFLFVFSLIFGLGVPALHIPGSHIAYAQGCPTGQEPNPGPTAIGVCLTEGGNQLTSASGFTVTISQTLSAGGKTQTYGTTFGDGLFITTADIAPVGQQLAVCTAPNNIPYQLEITATNSSGGSFKTTYNACNDAPDLLYYVPLAVSTTGGGQQFGAVKGCITYTAPDGTTQPFASTGIEPAQAIITGPSGSITVGFDLNGCLTGTQINSLVPGSYTITAQYAPGQTPHGVVQDEEYQKSFTITAGKTTDVSGKAALATTIKTTPPPATQTTPNISLVCSVSIFNPMTWLICPLVSAAQGAIEGLTSGIDSLLSVNTCELFSTNESCGGTATAAEKQTSSGFYQAWNTFRLFAIGLIVIAGLIMLIAQAAGTEIIDAYTIHKVLPRILIAVIFIALSWPLLNFAITFTNDVGVGIRAVIYTPFEGIGTTVKVNGGAATVGAIVGTATFLTLGLLGIASFMLTALLAVFVGFIVLFLRQIVVMMLVIFAPLAIACYVLPGTQKIWTFWKDTLLSMLIVFPIISAMIAMGRVFSVVMYNNRTGGVPTFVNEIGAFIVYFIPYFLLPAAFRWAGGAMATIGGFVNDRHKGAFDRLKNLRANQTEKNTHAMKIGNRFKSDNALANRFNATTRGIAALPSAGFNPTKMRSRFQAGTALAKEEVLKEYMEKNGAFSSIRGNDDYLQATMGNMVAHDQNGNMLDANGNITTDKSMAAKGGTGEGDWRRYLSAMGYSGRDLEQGVAAIREAKRETSNDVFSQAAVISNAATGTGWKDGGVTEMMESINDAFGGDRHGATNALAQMRSMASQSGRLDLAGSSFGKQAKQLGRMYEEKASTGAVSNETKLDVTHDLHGSVLETKGANEFARARGQAVDHLSKEMLYDLKSAHARVNEAQATVGSSQAGTAEYDAAVAAHSKAADSLAQKYASLANFHESLNHMAPENAQIIANNVLTQQVEGVSVMEHIDSYRRDQGTTGQMFRATRKDYDSRQYQADQGRGAMNPDE